MSDAIFDLNPTFISMEDFAKCCGLPKGTLDRLRRAEGFPCIRCGNTYKVNADQAKAWLLEYAAAGQRDKEVSLAGADFLARAKALRR